MNIFTMQKFMTNLLSKKVEKMQNLLKLDKDKSGKWWIFLKVPSEHI